MLNFDFLDFFLHHILWMIFQEKCSSCYIALTEPILFWLILLLEILGNICIIIVYFPGWDVINPEINHTFLIKSVCYDQKVKTKI